ncbi:MAG: 7-cyano-7-deazaguanine synthase, partial [Bdellovibrionales bacterium]|nr:7-cyano-7-deazaguanine synthase [Bdellovibrionales bacterium]
MSGSCVVLYSGGTDSTCVAALLAERFREIHLLTFYERGTEKSAVPRGNVEKLRQKFPLVSFVHELISTDRLVEFIAYENY